MNSKEDRPVGLTRDAGWQVGARKTLPIPLELAWGLLLSSDGLAAWLGEDISFVEGDEYRLADGTVGRIRVFQPESHLRMTWQPEGWDRPSTLQVRAIDKGGSTVIAFHQERLPSQRARSDRKSHFKRALDVLADLATKD